MVIQNNGCTDAWMSIHHEKIHGCMGVKGGRKDGSSPKPPLGCKNVTTAAGVPTASHKNLTVVYVLEEKQ